MLLPTRELPAIGGHSDGRSPAPPPGGVHRLGEGQEPRCQGHSEGQPRAFPEEHRLETPVKELNDEVMRTYHSHDFKTDLLNDTRTRLQHTQDELTAT
jgi:hypothetical protein